MKAKTQVIFGYFSDFELANECLNRCMGKHVSCILNCNSTNVRIFVPVDLTVQLVVKDVRRRSVNVETTRQASSILSVRKSSNFENFDYYSHK